MGLSLRLKRGEFKLKEMVKLANNGELMVDNGSHGDQSLLKAHMI